MPQQHHTTCQDRAHRTVLTLIEITGGIKACRTELPTLDFGQCKREHKPGHEAHTPSSCQKYHEMFNKHKWQDPTMLHPVVWPFQEKTATAQAPTSMQL